MVNEFRGLVPFLYPLVSFGGMVQLYSFWALSQVVTTAIPQPTILQLFAASMIYPLFLTAFFRLDGENPAFQFSTIAFMSAIFGLVIFPVLTVLLSAVITGFSTANPVFNVAVLLVDLVLAVGFLFKLSETDFHEMSNSLIIGSLVVFEFTSIGVFLYGTGTLHKWYAFVAGKIAQLMS
jgi:hypothetical protein